MSEKWILIDSWSEKNGKEAPVWGVAQFGEMSYLGSQTRVDSGRPKPKK